MLANPPGVGACSSWRLLRGLGGELLAAGNPRKGRMAFRHKALHTRWVHLRFALDLRSCMDCRTCVMRWAGLDPRWLHGTTPLVGCPGPLMSIFCGRVSVCLGLWKLVVFVETRFIFTNSSFTSDVTAADSNRFGGGLCRAVRSLLGSGSVESGTPEDVKVHRPSC